MPDFGEEKYASYVQLCQELQLERVLKKGDWVYSWRDPDARDDWPKPRSEWDGNPGWLEASAGAFVVDEGDGDSGWIGAQLPQEPRDWYGASYRWLPTLADWLGMLPEPWKLHMLAEDYRIEWDVPNGHAVTHRLAEEAAARLWVAVKKA
jgi:hypothetical protein